LYVFSPSLLGQRRVGMSKHLAQDLSRGVTFASIEIILLKSYAGFVKIFFHFEGLSRSEHKNKHHWPKYFH